MAAEGQGGHRATLRDEQFGQGLREHSAEAAETFRLAPHPAIPRCQAPLVVIVLDGLGESKYDDQYNGVHMARTPTLDALRAAGPRRYRLLKAHGTAVGLPSDADMGNSEVGHNALGAGQIVDQGAKCVDKALATGDLFKLDGWKFVEPNAVQGTLHLIGLLSDGGVHSRYDQLMLLMEGAIKQGVRRIRLHVLADGRDVGDDTAVEWVGRLAGDAARLSRERGADVRIASGGGRMKVTMDRYESDWRVVQRGYCAHVLGEAPHTFADPVEAVCTLKQGNAVSDQYVDPWVVVGEDGKPVGAVQDGDAVVTFNFRADRMVEISQALEYEKFDKFDRKRWPKIRFAGMMQYDGDLLLPKHFLVPPPLIERASEQYVVGTGLRVFACSESQKIGHVTFFWNGNRSGYLDPKLEKFQEIPSDQGISFDQAPAMKAQQIAAATRDAILSGQYDFVRCNFANPDMVGHTGNLKAAIEAVTVTDECIKVLLDAVEQAGGRFLLTADHGNAEDMVQRDKKGAPVMGPEGKPLELTSHTLNPVPCAIGGPGLPPDVHFRRVQGRGACLPCAKVAGAAWCAGPLDVETAGQARPLQARQDCRLLPSTAPLTSAGKGDRCAVSRQAAWQASAACDCPTVLEQQGAPYPNPRRREDLPGAGLANVTATFINLLGFEAPYFYEPTLVTAAKEE